MGITIDESINGIEKRILPIFDNDADHKALVKAIDTMRKYQKIKQILDDCDLEAWEVLEMIRKEVENGKID